MSRTPAATSDDGFDVIVADDGSVPAAELARLGVRPGAHLRLIVSENDTPKQVRHLGPGRLAGTVPPEVIDEFIRALDECKAERRALYGGVQPG